MSKNNISKYAEEVMENIMAIHRGIIKGKMGFSGMDQITIPQYASMALIESAGALKMKDIAMEMKISLPAATGMISRLHKMGLVKRVYDPKDRRTINITLTPKGIKTLNNMKNQKKKLFESVFSKLTLSERNDYLRILKKVKNIIYSKTMKIVLLFIILISFKSPSFADNMDAIDLQTAINRTLQNSWSIKNSLLDTQIADDKIQNTKDTFKPTLKSTLQHSYSETGETVISPIPSTETKQDEWLNSVSKMFESGFSASASVNFDHTDTTIPSFADIDDNRKNFILSLSYPLIKNRQGRTLRYPVEIAQFGKQISDLQYSYLIEGEILATITDFYQVCLLNEEKKAVLANLEGATFVVDTMKRRFDIGTSESKDYLRSQAAVSAQKTRLIVVNNALAKSRLNLLKTMGEKVDSREFDIDYDLSTSLSRIENKTEIVLTAYPQRKDLKQLDYQVKIAEKNIALNEDDKAPNLDISTSYATDGMGGNNTFSESETPAWIIGLTFKKTFGGEAKVSESLKEKEKLENTIEDYKELIAEEVYTAIEDVNFLLEALAEAENLTKIQKERLSEEEKDFNLGRTSVRDIEEARDDLTSAQLVLAQAKINVIRAYARLLFVTGELNQNFYMRLR